MAGIGELIRSLRESSGLTQEELAERSGLSARTVSDIERGLRRRLYADTAERLATALRLSAGEREYLLVRARGEQEASADLDPGFRRRFVSWHVARAEQVMEDIGNEERWFAVLDADEPNFTTALRWADEAGDAQSLLRLATALWQYWQARGAFSVGRRWLQRGLETSPPTDPRLRARAWWGMAWLAYQQGDDAAAAEAAARLSELSAASGDPVGRRNAATVNGMVALAADRVQDARRELADAVELARTVQQPWLLGASLLNLGIASIAAGSIDEARHRLEEAWTVFDRIGDERFRARCAGYLGLASLTGNDTQSAQSLFVQSLTAFVALSDPNGTAEGLTGLAAVAASRGDGERAAKLGGAAERLRESNGGRALPVERRIAAGHLEAARRTIASDAWDAAWTEGRAHRLEDLVEGILNDLA